MTQRVIEAKDLFNDGKNIGQICDVLNVRPRWARRLLQRAGVRRRVGRPKGSMRHRF